jgi:peptidoglycan/LPS O-acetylase OafA/YrhL
LFIFNLVPQHAEGFVWASWSIGVEMLFYALLPMIVFAVTTLPRAVVFFILSSYLSYMWDSALASAAAPAFSSFSHYSLIFHMPNFACGILAFFAWKQMPRSDPRLGNAALIGGAVLLFLSLLFALEIIQTFGDALRRIALAPCFGLIVLGMAISPPKILLARPLTRLGETSLSLYLLHPLIIGVLMVQGVFTAIYGFIPDMALAYLACLALVVTILIPAAILTYRTIEQPGERLGGRLLTRSHWNEPQFVTPNAASQT